MEPTPTLRPLVKKRTHLCLCCCKLGPQLVSQLLQLRAHECGVIHGCDLGVSLRHRGSRHRTGAGNSAGQDR